jgi:hypothetical protein
LLRARAAEQAARAGSRRTASLAELAQAGRKMDSMGSVALAQKGGCAHVAKAQRGSIVQTLKARGAGANREVLRFERTAELWFFMLLQHAPGRY